MKLKIALATILLSGTSLLYAAAPPLETNKLNINQATAEQIAHRMNGVGLSKAKAIVLYRQQHGDFEKLEQLVKVKGIGLSTLEKNRVILKVK